MTQPPQRRKHLRVPRLIRSAAQETMRNHEAIEAVVLYGSRARGDHRRGSDWDIAVLSRLNEDDALEAAKPLYEPEIVKRHWTEILCSSSEKIEQEANTAGTLGARIAREGVLIAGDWTRPECRQGRELDIDAKGALNWCGVAMANGRRATGWLGIASREEWEADNEAGARVQRMAEQVTKGILATFGVYESDIHELERTARELENAYRVSGWKHDGRSDFAERIRALKSRGRAALRAEKWTRKRLEPLDETIERLGQVLSLTLRWLSCHATLFPESREQVVEVAREVAHHMDASVEDVESAAPELIEHVQKTRADARRLAAELERT